MALELVADEPRHANQPTDAFDHALGVSPWAAVWALVFLVLVHKLEYVLNARIVGGHIGYPWTLEMIAVATKHENVYIDTSAYIARRYPAEVPPSNP